MYDASRMFDAARGDASKVDNALVLLTQRSKKHENTLHFVGMSEYNVEALVVADDVDMWERQVCRIVDKPCKCTQCY